MCQLYGNFVDKLGENGPEVVLCFKEDNASSQCGVNVSELLQ